MKNQNDLNQMDQRTEKNHMRSKTLTGLIIVAVGILIFLDQIGLHIPRWLLKWEMILIAVGIVSLIKHSFRKTSGYIMILIGSAFLLNDFFPNVIDVQYIWPLIIVIFGLSILFKSGLFGKRLLNKRKESAFADFSKADFLNASSIFSGVTNKVLTKNFKGANLTSVFGGNEVNLSQADFVGEIDIDITCIFGGVTIIVPSGWKVKTDMTSIFGGIDDQRPIYSNESPDDQKVVRIKGICIFGGVEIHSYN